MAKPNKTSANGMDVGNAGTSPDDLHSQDDAVAQIEDFLAGRLERMRGLLKATTETLRRLEENDARVCELEEMVSVLTAEKAQLQDLNKQLTAKNAEFQAKLAEDADISRQLQEDNRRLVGDCDILKRRSSELEMAKSYLEERAELLERSLQDTQKAAAQEVGRVVKALLSSRSGTLWRTKASTREKARHLVAKRIIDPEWYRSFHSDVAAAGIDPAVHYVLHGAEEGRPARPFPVDTNAKKKK